MTKKFRLFHFVLPLAVLFSGNVHAVDVDDLIEARQGLMELYAVNMDLLGDMIRNRTPYTQKKAQALADNLLALTQMNNGALWPRGSSLADQGLAGKTSAKPDIWQKPGEVSESYNNLRAAVEVLAKNAGWSQTALEENIKDVNQACKGCHRKFRSKK